MEGTSTPVAIPELTVSLENPISIRSNFPQLKAWLDAELERYKLEVTADTLAAAKKAAAELSDLAKKLDRARIDYAKKFKQPISDWEAEAKTLFNSAVSARDEIIAQTKVFDDKTRELCKTLMNALLAEEYNRLEVDPEYRVGFSDIESQVGISKLTSKGALNKAAGESICGIAARDRGAQDRASARMNQVKADCLTAGVEPLTKEQCHSFLDLCDGSFSARLAEMIAVEVKKAASARAKIAEEEKGKAEAAANAKMEAERKARKERDERRMARILSECQRLNTTIAAHQQAALLDGQDIEFEQVFAQWVCQENKAHEKRIADEFEAKRLKAVQDQEKEEKAKNEREAIAAQKTQEPIVTPQKQEISQPAKSEAAQAGPAEELKTVMIRVCLLIEVTCKLSSSPEKVQKVIAPFVAEAARKAHEKINSVEVVQ